MQSLQETSSICCMYFDSIRFSFHHLSKSIELNLIMLLSTFTFFPFFPFIIAVKSEFACDIAGLLIYNLLCYVFFFEGIANDFFKYLHELYSVN